MWNRTSLDLVGPTLLSNLVELLLDNTAFVVLFGDGIAPKTAQLRCWGRVDLQLTWLCQCALQALGPLYISASLEHLHKAHEGDSTMNS